MRIITEFSVLKPSAQKSRASRETLRGLSIVLALLLAFFDFLVITPADRALALTAPSIRMDATLNTEKENVLDSKTGLISADEPTVATISLTPRFSTGEAVGVKAHVFLPWLEHIDGEYHLVTMEEAEGEEPSALGVQASVVASEAWRYDEQQKGGWVTLQYVGRLGAGNSPGFQLELTTYNDGTDGPMGSVPEGTKFEIEGYVEYDRYELGDEESSSWKTPGGADAESRLNLISSDLTWEAVIDSYGDPFVPIWDRYQYIDYIYKVKNTSENNASLVEGYTISLDIDSIGIYPNGIIPYDINRWLYNDDGPPTENGTPSNTEGKFVGIPGEGGILIYDVTGLDTTGPNGISEDVLAGLEPIPYTYSGAGLISVDQENDENRQELTPEGVEGETEREYLISLPLSRQGFPNLPTDFKVTVVTDVLFATSAHWSKTAVEIRNIALPEYQLDFDHETKQPEVVYAYETYNEISNIWNSSDAPIFEPHIDYTVDEHFEPQKIVYEFALEDAARFQNIAVSYSFIDPETQEENTVLLAGVLEENEVSQTGTLTFSIPDFVDIGELTGFNLPLFDQNVSNKVERDTEIPLNIKIYGEPYEVGQRDFLATGIYTEKIASNDDYGQNTTYTEVLHETNKATDFFVIYPDEVKPEAQVFINNTPNSATVEYGEESKFDFYFGVNDTVAKDTKTVIVLNSEENGVVKEALHDIEVTYKKELFERAQNVRLSYVTLDGQTESISLEEHDLDEDFVFSLPDGVSEIVIESDEFTSAGKEHLVSVSAKVENGLETQHIVEIDMRTYQPKPYDKHNNAKATGIADIKLPKELKPVVGVTGVYGDLKTDGTTRVGYQSDFEVEYKLSTDGVLSPSSEYVIDKLDASKNGELLFKKVTLQQHYIDNSTMQKITFVAENGAKKTIPVTGSDDFTVSLNDLADLADSSGSILIAEIIIEGINLKLEQLETIAVVEYFSDIEFDSMQPVRATFTGSQEIPYVGDKTATNRNNITVQKTQTKVKIEGVNQVNGGLGRGSEYDMQIYERWSYTSGGRTVYVDDYTLDQGYKTLGGFTATLQRPTATYDNNNQTTRVEVDLPHEQFDLYYLKIREELKPYIKEIDIFRDDSQTPWRTISGNDWVNNSQEVEDTSKPDYWRIGTARPAILENQEIFKTHESFEEEPNHAYYKGPWDEDVLPENPVRKVVITLEFKRLGNNETPQISGLHNDVVEYMGRFYAPSIDGKKPTDIRAFDTIGLDAQTLSPKGNSQPALIDTGDPRHEKEIFTRVFSLVAYPFAQSSTGAHDNTKLKEKIITMGEVGEYKASVQNYNPWTKNAPWSHGPDVYVPVATEWDEWLRKYNPESFHDELVYEFTYPASPTINNLHNYDPISFIVHDSTTLKYMTGVRVTGVHNGQDVLVEQQFTEQVTDAAKFIYDNSDSRGKGIHSNNDGTYTVSFNDAADATEIYPKTFEVFFSEINGFGDNTAEIAGVGKERLGDNLDELDISVQGIVNGNTSLTGTTTLYKILQGTENKTYMHSTSAILRGYTPYLGAQVNMDFDAVKVYDYAADGITPNKTKVTYGIANSSEADIKEFVVNLAPDGNFRSQLLEVPKQMFNGSDGDWKVDSVTLRQGNSYIEIPLELFKLNQDSGNYELDIVALFEAAQGEESVLKVDGVDVTFGGDSTLLKKHVSNIAVRFAPKDDTVALWGSLARESNSELPNRMSGEGNLFLTGVWVDEDAAGNNWNSKPTFVAAGGKASNENVMANTSFNVNAEVLSTYQSFTRDRAQTNNRIKPTLTKTSSASNPTVAPRLFSRVAQMELRGMHLKEDFSKADTNDVFYDVETEAQINYRNIAVGDTVKVLYELKNTGTKAPDHSSAGQLPVFNPMAHIIAPDNGLIITDVQVADNFFNSNDKLESLRNTINEDRASVTGEYVTATVRENKKGVDIEYGTLENVGGIAGSGAESEMLLDYGHSVFIYVEFTSVNDYAKTDDGNETQNKELRWNTYARPGYAHHLQGYDVKGVDNAPLISGTTAVANFDATPGNENLGRLYNIAYKFAHPNNLQITSVFDKENISGETMTVTVKNIQNEPLHDNTNLSLYLTLDTKNLKGFELTRFPKPRYPEGFEGEYEDPIVYFLHTSGDDPEGQGGAEPQWVKTEDFDPSIHHLDEINEMWVDYGTVPARIEGTGDVFTLPNFDFDGVGHWQTPNSLTNKTYVIESRVKAVYTHKNEEQSEDSDNRFAVYQQIKTDSKTAYKPMPQIEFNIQSFDQRADALEPYQGNEVGKTDYLAGDDVHYRLTAKNHTTNQGASTNTNYGKAPLLNPIVFDKVPEYLLPDEGEREGTIFADSIFSENSDGTIDFGFENAVAEEIVTVKMLDADGHEREFKAPKVTVEKVQGLDVAGAQQFANELHNNGQGRLSSSEPSNTTVNPATEINFYVFKYEFEDEQIGRGEQLEIVVSTKARTNDLPRATYKDGRAVFAPLFGWYGNNNPVPTSAHKTSMDMASLLHDAGISGDRGHEMTSTEFLSNSYSWHPGATNSRQNPLASSGNLSTYYDESANTRKTHTAYLRETADNNLYTGFSSGSADDNFNFSTRVRVSNDNSSERILWAQDGMQLNRAWLYGASEMVPDTARSPYGVSDANFYEHDGSLRSSNHYLYDYSPYAEDDYTYGVELHEEFTVKLHAANLGDRAIESGLEYLEILPLGVTPYNDDGQWLGIKAFNSVDNEIDSDSYSYEIVQTPSNDQGFRAPAQSQEATTYVGTDDTGTDQSGGFRDDMIPYVVRVKVRGELPGMFNSPDNNTDDKYQRVEIRVRVYEELAPSADGISYWHDEFTLTTIEEEDYLEIYSKEYGAYHRGISQTNPLKFPNNGMNDGVDVNSFSFRYNTNTTRYVSVEPWGKYIRGLNARATALTNNDQATKPALVTGDQIAMRKPTLRIWSAPSKDSYPEGVDESIENFSVNLYEEFTINSTVENTQLEVLPEYNRINSGYNSGSTTNRNNDIWVNAPQTIGGARGGWFEPTVTIALPYGVAPVLKNESDEKRIARYYDELDDLNEGYNEGYVVDFTAVRNDVSFNTWNRPVAETQIADLSEFFDVRVETVENSDLGKRFVLHFVVNEDRKADIAYGESLVISPRVAVIDTPMYKNDREDIRFQEVLTFAGSKRPVFNAIVSDSYQTGSTPSTTARDLKSSTTGVNSIYSSNGKTINANDRTRRDSTSLVSGGNSSGVLKITERLISATRPYDKETEIVLSDKFNDNDGWKEHAASFMEVAFNDKPEAKHEKSGAYGGTVINLKRPSITNTTKAANYEDTVEETVLEVDASGKYWYLTEIENSVTAHNDPYEQHKSSGDVVNSRFLITHFVTNFANDTGEVRIKIVNGEDEEEVLTRDQFEELGYSVERVAVHQNDLKVDDTRNRIQWVVTTPQSDRGTFGELKSGQSFKFLYEAQLIDGYEENIVDEEDAWIADELKVDSYVSLLPSDKSLIPEGPSNNVETQDERDFIVQGLESIYYHAFESDENKDLDINADGLMDGLYAHSQAEIQILKPKAEVRVNTTRPRIEYSNGQVGDNYFNAADDIEYLVTHAKNTGSALKEFVVENILPTSETDESTVNVSGAEIFTNTIYVSTGVWELPEEMLERLDEHNRSVDDSFKTFVYISNKVAVDGYEVDDWTLLNPGGTKISENKVIAIPEGNRDGLQKIRVVVRALDPHNFLVPQGTRLKIDADPEVDGDQEVTETDPDNRGSTIFPEGVTENAIKIGMRISSDEKMTLFLYDTVQAWGNYVADKYAKLDQSETRSYLTPSRPVVNVKYSTQYFRYSVGENNDIRFAWSDNTSVNMSASAHLKFKGEFINASEDMWDEEENNTYAEDLLIDPFVTFHIPNILRSGGEFTHVPYDSINSNDPLSEDYESSESLRESQNNLWTWYIMKADGTAASPESSLKLKEIHNGPWPNLDRNVVSVWFEGQLEPGDMVVVEFIGVIESFVPGVDPQALKSDAYVSNNTGLLYPLNSKMNSGNKLGYTTDNRDLNDNGMINDRLVSSERTIFSFQSYQNYKKTKKAYSNLNQAGTSFPEITPVEQGGIFEFEIDLENPQAEGSEPYRYPIFYDVLPHLGDTSILKESEDAEPQPRNSTYTAWLTSENMQYQEIGQNIIDFERDDTEEGYTVYVGPFKRNNGEIVETDMISHTDAGIQEFYNSLGVPGDDSQVRNEYFVELTELETEKPELLKEAKTILVMFNDPNAKLDGDRVLRFKYQMKSPLNAPGFMEQFDAPESTIKSHLWNSFIGTAKVNTPQESNLAGIQAYENEELVYIGNYVWNDVNYNAKQDEGETFSDNNDRAHIKPTEDLNYDGSVDDPGINDVKVTLLTPNGRYVDRSGQAIHQDGTVWYVVNDGTGEYILDDVFGGKIESVTGPLVKYTETDFYGHEGYYTFSNIAPGEYRVMFEFPEDYDRFSVTTEQVFKETNVQVAHPGDTLAGIHAENNELRLRAISEVALVDETTTDEERMSFDIGVAERIKIGGTVFEENLDTLDGYKTSAEAGLEGYHVYLMNENGEPVLDSEGDPYITRTDSDGEYSFDFLPVGRKYYITVTDENNEFNTEMLVSPIVHNIDPFEEDDDNDAFNPKGTEQVRTNTFTLDIESMIKSGFEDRYSINIGFYKKSVYGVIGNRVWHDLNRNGIQDPDEPGIADQKLYLEQYIWKDESWQLTDFTDEAYSNEDGYYYFTEVPGEVIVEEDDGTEVTYETKYQVVVNELPEGYTFTLTNVGDNATLADDEVDSDFYGNGTMHDEEFGENLVSVIEIDGNQKFGITDNTIDLGLVEHALGWLAGEVFIDENSDGLKNDESEPAQIYTAGLEVLTEDGWVSVKLDDDNLMIEPRFVTVDDESEYLVENTGSYLFENLHIINTDTLEAYQYRVVVNEVLLWQDITDLRVGNDPSIDNDFTQQKQDFSKTAVSETYTLGKVYDHQKEGLPQVESGVGAPAKNVDLGLIPLKTTRIIGDTVYEDVDRNGTQDSDEPGIAGITVQLFKLNRETKLWESHTDVNGNSNLVTDERGQYEFVVQIADLDSESEFYRQVEEYRVLIEATANMRLVEVDSVFFYQDENIVDGIEIEKPFSYVLADGIALAEQNEYGVIMESAEDNLAMDAGFAVYETAVTIGGRAWEDANENGLQDPDEEGIAELEVTLWEKIAGEWEKVQDLLGNSTALTDENGDYSFRVSPTHYEENQENFLAVREYLVTAERAGYQVWSPLNAGDDHTIDSDIHEYGHEFPEEEPQLPEDEEEPQLPEDGEEEPEFPEVGGLRDMQVINTHTGFTHVFNIADRLENSEGLVYVDLESVFDDMYMGMGIKTLENVVAIGGKVWNDQNEDGVKQRSEDFLSGEEVTLWEEINGVWQIVSDLDGENTRITDENGEYEFLVSPTHYSLTSDGYLLPRNYRTTLNAVDGFFLSETSETSFVDSGRSTSVTAELNELNEEGRVEIRLVKSDYALDYPLVMEEDIPEVDDPEVDDPKTDDPEEENDLPATGLAPNLAQAMLLLAAGLLIAGVVLYRRENKKA